ncbi:MAG: gamma-glutamylcyclotransferase family protein [Thermodesulfobacteriota bacterium]
MASPINKVFVYGTLLQGEVRSQYMADCKLLKTLEIPGHLYDTKRGYPTAIIDEDSDNKIFGELYLMDRPQEKLEQLDEVEMVEDKQYDRISVKHENVEFYTYIAGPGLSDFCRQNFEIETGDWRAYESISFYDPLAFIRNFEDRQKYLYREPVTKEAKGCIYLKGNTPVLISAPHSSVHQRMGKLKRQEFYTGALTALLNSITGCHALYTNRLMEIDPNYYDESPYKKKLVDIVQSNNIKFILDIHGTGSERGNDIYPGTGIENEFLLGNYDLLEKLETRASIHKISVGGLDVFPAAKQMTVTKYGAKVLEVPSMQLEINRNLREPEKSPKEFMKLIKFLKEYLENLSNLIS